jgi:hypothetical protein
MNDIYKQGIRAGIRFLTSKGNLTIAQLFSLSVTGIEKVVRSLRKQISETGSTSDGLEFLDSSAPAVDPLLQLSFDIAKDVYITRKSERDAATNAAENKKHNEKILGLVSKKRENALENLSEKELLDLLK